MARQVETSTPNHAALGVGIEPSYDPMRGLARPHRVALFGSTGSIGRSTLEVARASPAAVKIVALSAHSQWDEAIRQAHVFRPRWLVVTRPDDARQLDASRLPSDVQLLIGPEHLEMIAASDEVDIVVSAIVGLAGLRSTWAAVQSGKRVALANKETLVAAGGLIMDLAEASQAEIIPVDSEHCAVFQAMRAGRRSELRRVILTASGGPFRSLTLAELQQVSVAQALAHPVWQMGRKITVDSATMMNKALEIIEARWLFGLDPAQIEVLVHPQSIVHSMVEFLDGSVMAQMSPPDMRLPIQYALSYPARWPAPAESWNLQVPFSLDFEPPDYERFPAIPLGLEVARAGGTAGVVLNAANEAAVAGFLDEKIGFTEVVPACRAVLDAHDFEAQPSLERIYAQDQWAREEMDRWIGA